MATPYIGEIRLFAGNFAPVGWFFCQGQLLPIANYESLYSLIGTTYGGDGQQTFALPNLTGRVPVHQGQSGGGRYVLGQRGGAEQVALTANQAGSHSHSAACNSANGISGSPDGGILAGSDTELYTIGAVTGAMNSTVIVPTGSGQPHENRPPYLALNFIIAHSGIYPTQS